MGREGDCECGAGDDGGKPGRSGKFAQFRDEIIPDWLVKRKKKEAERE